ncbi:hypothetical protein ENKNEFLB_02038 [Nocardioides aquaticus]|uniref:DUF2185 domain-containing protein n=1 Tax=Nocardioides aquaticus TaxID=160826 RepID=A0ABX8ELZ9_9ACTN|nr:hypothetical protein [Nocardioides aquaticus]QVT79653.1 hypothetical protein ENKNEFLB_02038 [Nocardioides aquaticus]
MDEQTARQVASGAPILETSPEALTRFAPDHVGQVLALPRDEGWQLMGVVRSDVSRTERETFEQWARERFYVVAVSGSFGDDGWLDRGDGGWQLTARAVEMPPDPFT